MGALSHWGCQELHLWVQLTSAVCACLCLHTGSLAPDTQGLGIEVTNTSQGGLGVESLWPR